jgi:hypothetical protein
MIIHLRELHLKLHIEVSFVFVSMKVEDFVLWNTPPSPSPPSPPNPNKEM